MARRQFDEIPPWVEYFLTEKGESVIPILQSICHWAGLYQEEGAEPSLPQCQKCGYRESNYQPGYEDKHQCSRP